MRLAAQHHNPAVNVGPPYSLWNLALNWANLGQIATEILFAWLASIHILVLQKKSTKICVRKHV